MAEVRDAKRDGRLTDAEWAVSFDTRRMVRMLGRRANGRAHRLFAVACCRRIDALIVDERSRWAVDVARRWADGRATEEEFVAAREEARDVADELRYAEVVRHGADPSSFMDVVMAPEFHRFVEAAEAASSSLAKDLRRPFAGDRRRENADCPMCCESAGHALVTDEMARRGWRWPDGWDWRKFEPDRWEAVAREWAEVEEPEARAQCDILRDLFGDRTTPPAVDLGPGWEGWNDGFLPQFAAAIYRNEDFANLPTLAEALEESGCPDAAILEHLRGPGPHWPGCWALERLMGPLAPRMPRFTRTPAVEIDWSIPPY